jgi:ubiquinone/menaquinone biosynthesis C-methylase UbiE
MPAPDVPFETQINKLWGHIRGLHVLHLIRTGADLGWFRLLAEAGERGLTPEDLAAPRGLHLPFVRVWWKTAIAWEILDPVADGRARLAPHFDAILAKPGDPRFLLPYVVATLDHFQPDLATHTAAMADGAIRTFQEHGHAFTEAIGDTTAGLHALMARRILPGIEEVRAALACGGSFLDYGCGIAGLVLQVANAFPEARCAGTDIHQDGLEQARRAVAASGLEDRVTIHDGNVWRGDRASVDVITMVEVLHEIPEGVRPDVLAHCRHLLREDGRLVILDETYPEDADLRKPDAALAVQTQFNEMTWGNVVPTAQQQEGLLADAGLRIAERTTIGGIFTQLIVTPQGN